MKPVLFLITITLVVSLVASDPYTLSIIHINDFHARFEPTDQTGGICDPGEECIGGYARTVYTVKRLLKENEGRNVVYFNAGDSFQGTLWYNVGRWNVTSQFLNMLPADAMTLGNHEFDHSIEGVVPFLETLKSPMLVANMDSINEPTIAGKYEKSMIIERGGRKIGIVGVILETTYDLANTGKLIFSNESAAIREEAKKLRAAGANIIIGISHCGYDVDKLIAVHAGDDIDVIVGAHSHTFLYPEGKPLPGPDRPRGNYPTEILHENGHRVLIVQAMAYAKYVGYIEVTFDEDGNVIGHEGAPLYMGANVPQDEEITKMLPAWSESANSLANTVIGETEEDLMNTMCSSQECNIGNFYCDAVVHAYLKDIPFEGQLDRTDSVIAIGTSNDMRVSIPKGPIKYSQIFALVPYNCDFLSFNLPGYELLAALEHSVKSIDLSSSFREGIDFPQVAGINVVYNLKAPPQQRVVAVTVRSTMGLIPKYEKLDYNKTYRIIATRFVARGGFDFKMFREHGSDIKISKLKEIDAIIDYITTHQPINTGIEKRIIIRSIKK